jgi:Amidohydrolase family
VDASGKYLIPGLWDMHVHTGQREIFLPLYVANGITGVRDKGGDLEEPTGDLSARYVQLRLWREAIDRGSLVGPRLVIAGFLIDGYAWHGNVAAANAGEGRQAVDVLKQVGVDFIKVKSSLSRETYFAIADESRNQHIVFAGHVPDAVRAAEASDAGQKSIEHLTGIALGCSREESQIMEELAKAIAARDRTRYGRATARTTETFDKNTAMALFAELAKNRTWQVPTLVELKANALGGPTSSPGQSPSMPDPRWRFLPAALRERWSKEQSPSDSEAGRNLFATEISLTRQMHKAGVPFMTGTDSANPLVLPGFGLHEELKLFVSAGFTPMEALQAATINPARYVGREADLGTIEPSKLADFVLLDANPLEDISNTQKIWAVVVNGRYLSRSDLDAMLAGVEKAVH